jgi:MoaA/NifB/PqqE/SkfB family radical SAM enzyme
MPLDHLSAGIFAKSFDKTKLKNLKVISFAGDRGDPVMNPGLLDMIDFFNFVDVISINTNGSIQSPAWWRELAKTPNLQVLFSIDGLENTNHIYRVGLEFNKIMENAQAFISAGGQAIWKCILFKHNEHQIEQIQKLSKQMGFAEVQFRPAGRYRFQGLDVWPVKIKGQYSHDIEPSSIDDRRMSFFDKKYKQFINRENLRDHRLDRLCPWSRENKLYINYFGQVLPCCMMHAETLYPAPRTSLGVDEFLAMVGGDFNNISLYHHTLEEILHNDFYDSGLEDSLKSDKSMHRVCHSVCKNRIIRI